MPVCNSIGRQGGFVKGFEFDLPATYRIRVRGYLDDSLSDRLGSMAIKATGQAEGVPETLLVGWLADQAALSGVLNALYGLHLPLLSLELVNLEEEQDGKEAARKMKRKAYERELARLEAT